MEKALFNWYASKYNVIPCEICDSLGNEYIADHACDRAVYDPSIFILKNGGKVILVQDGFAFHFRENVYLTEKKLRDLQNRANIMISCRENISRELLLDFLTSDEFDAIKFIAEYGKGGEPVGPASDEDRNKFDLPPRFGDDPFVIPIVIEAIKILQQGLTTLDNDDEQDLEDEDKYTASEEYAKFLGKEKHLHIVIQDLHALIIQESVAQKFTVKSEKLAEYLRPRLKHVERMANFALEYHIGGRKLTNSAFARIVGDNRRDVDMIMKAVDRWWDEERNQEVLALPSDSLRRFNNMPANSFQEYPCVINFVYDEIKSLISSYYSSDPVGTPIRKADMYGLRWR